VYERGVCNGNANLHHAYLRVEASTPTGVLRSARIRLQPALLRVDSPRCRCLGAASCLAAPIGEAPQP
jgi:hypothetical protein